MSAVETSTPTSTGNPSAVNHAFFMLVRTTTAWLQLPPPERFAFLEQAVLPILRRHPEVAMRFFDSEAFHAACTDVVLWETADVLAYQAVVEELRETPFWGTYFEVVDIVASVEDGYARHYGVAPLSSVGVRTAGAGT